MTERSPGSQLRDAVAQGTIVVPGAFNALVARMVERAGCEAVYLSGAALSSSVLGLPDVGLVTLSELVAQTTLLARNVSIPIIVDADTGFGAPVNVERTVLELEAAGAAAVQFEDQVLPKRCGHLSGKSLVPADQMCAKLRAAVNTRQDESLVVVARTDAAGVTGLDDAIDRARRYLAVGADWIFPEALADRDQFEKFARSVEAPLVANMTEFGTSPLLTVGELSDLGYAAVLYPVTLLRVAMKAVEAGLDLLLEEGTQQELLELMQTRQELYDLIDYVDYDERDRAYFGGEPQE